jgi:hypothetical protein
MDSSRFKVVFDKLSEATSDEDRQSARVDWIASEELDEIAELRRLAVALAEPDPQSCAVS